jgi:hypothetical protein
LYVVKERRERKADVEEREVRAGTIARALAPWG